MRLAIGQAGCWPTDLIQCYTVRGGNAIRAHESHGGARSDTISADCSLPAVLTVKRALICFDSQRRRSVRWLLMVKLLD